MFKKILDHKLPYYIKIRPVNIKKNYDNYNLCTVIELFIALYYSLVRK